MSGSSVSDAERAAIANALAVLERACKGDLEARVTGIDIEGDLGELLWRINEVLDRSDAFTREAWASLEAVTSNRYYRRVSEVGMLGAYLDAARTINGATGAIEARVTAFSDVVSHFEHGTEAVLQEIASAGDQLTQTAAALDSRAQETRGQAKQAAAGANTGAENVQAMAAAVEEVSASVGEISDQVHQSFDRVSTAVGRAASAEDRVASLSSLGGKIEDVVSLIDDIAGKTNLLALNATIEAARAGEAGRGFAVVASEVKALAGKTINATEAIRSTVSAMNTETGTTAETFKDIEESVARIQEAFTAIASAVEEQSAAMDSIAHNISDAAGGMSDVAGHVSGISASADETGDSAGEVLAAATQVVSLGEDLGRSVQSFLGEVRRVV